MDSNVWGETDYSRTTTKKGVPAEWNKKGLEQDDERKLKNGSSWSGRWHETYSLGEGLSLIT